MSAAFERSNALPLRELNNVHAQWDIKERRTSSVLTSGGLGTNLSAVPEPLLRPVAPVSGRTRLSSSQGRFSTGGSPGFDRLQRNNPPMCGEIAGDILDMFFTRETAMLRDAKYMDAQTEVTEKMRTILVDWLVDVHLKFKLHPETLFLAVDIVDRYLSSAKVVRSQLQLVGITAMLLAAKYEEIWPPEVKECISISANTYTRDELLNMERSICSVLQFKLTVPTSYPFLARLLETTEADEQTRNAAIMFLEYAAQDYSTLSFLPSQVACAAMYLANLLLEKRDPWNFTLQHYSRTRLANVQPCARRVLSYLQSLTGSKYQAIKRKYSSPKFCDVARLPLPMESAMFDF